MEASWLKAVFFVCGWPLLLTPPALATFAITMTEGEAVSSAGTLTLGEEGCWPWLVGMALGGAETELPFLTHAVAGGCCTAVIGPHFAGTCKILT